MTNLIPTTKTKPNFILENQIILAYGQPKIGKSTFASQMDNPIFLMTEPGLNSLETFQVKIDSWQRFLDVAAELAKNGNQFKNIVIDTVDNLFQFCERHVLEKAKVEHASDLAYGKGFTLINNEFGRVIKKLSLLRYGLVFISHSKEKEVDTRTGKLVKTIPSLPAGPSKIVMGLSDMILLFEPKEGKDKDGNTVETRVIRTKASRTYEAGARIRGLADEIPLSFDSFKKSYENTVKQQGKN